MPARTDPQEYRSYLVTGMDCADCALHVEKAVKKVPGVTDIKINLVSGQIDVFSTAQTLSDDLIFKAVRNAGYDVAEQRRTKEAPEHEHDTQRLFLTTLIAGILLILGNFFSHLVQISNLSFAFFVLTIIIGGFPIAVRGYKEARHLRLGMNFLMSVAIIGAGALGEWSEAATVVFLFVLAQHLESRTMNRARKSIDTLMDQRPNTAQVRKNGSFETVLAGELRAGDIIGVKPGDNIPVDGTIITGTSSVDQSSITGESVPVDVDAGNTVYAGTLNKSGFLEIQVDREYSDSTYAKIIDLVARAQAQKSAHQTFVEKFSAYYTPAVIFIAVLIAILPPLLAGMTWAEWIYRALVLLVIACPCAFVISTPVTVVSGLTNAMRKGILIKGGKYLELFARVQAIAFDKTGTLTEGKLLVRQIIPVNTMDTDLILKTAASLAEKSGHPVSEAIVEYAQEKGVGYLPVEKFQAVEGMGIEGKINGRVFILGNHRFFESRGWCDTGLHEKLNQVEDSNHTAVLLGTESGIEGIIAIADHMRGEAAQTVRNLKKNGIRHVHLVTGDNQQTARSIAHDSDVDEFDAGLLPQDKVTVINRLISKFHIVSMIGDGVNDAPALAQSSVGVAMGVRGSDTALETADIALMSDDLSRLVYLKRLSARTIRIIKQNIFIALSLKFLFLFLAIPGLATLWMAVFADMGASLIVIMNGLRVLAMQPETS
jgi:Cd2+/Zn2+-exporting ATPase